MCNLREMLQDPNRVIVLDGAMGTMLERAGLDVYQRPEEINMKHADVVSEITAQYVAAGSDIVYANTFQVNRHRLKDSAYTVEEVIFAAVSAAKTAVAATDTKIALDIGPIGLLVEPTGELRFEDAVDIFKEIVEAGVKAGCDLVVFETMSDLNELRAGVIAAKENSNLPIFATMTFEKSERTYTGCSLEAMVAVMDGLGVDALGINCSKGPMEILPLAQKLVQITDTPIIVKANAGLPDPVKGTYSIAAEEFGKYMKEYAALGIRIIGGCCGTQPSYIEEIKKQAKKAFVKHGAKRDMILAGLATSMTEVDETLLKESLIEPDEDYIKTVKTGEVEEVAECLMKMEDKGEEFIFCDVTGAPDEVVLMKEVVKKVQSMSNTPFIFRSNDADVIEAALRPYQGRAVVMTDLNAVKAVKPIAEKYGAILYTDEQGIVSY
ncbi:homocysteine S-methyltransferase family protein [Eubacterium oxidoreducens]|uniref:Methionine synthase I (Cobalamin-dependent), methyltransferase domain n=1 Tax=Eubacterium oxidoreducens TaxID=1732 RepID=A0A1G6C9Y9_EUBOX|nr:homocysteine S-methyltransferase family protein [Eubacterium oxidoreducens]SDB29683.1 Methionine synthase I (cobalamin-dependent), methyltransferase domain [Eubacterium oxidoreducens]